MGRGWGRQIHGDGGGRRYRVLHLAPWCIQGLGPEAAGGIPVVLLKNRVPAGLRKEALDRLSS